MAIVAQMKHLITIFAIFWTCAFPAMSRTLYESSVAKTHQQWMSQYGRSYADDLEKEKRFNIFMENLEYIEKFNSGGNKSYKLGLNQFSDLTEEEFIASHTGFKISNLAYTSSVTLLNLSDVPTSLDWRKKGAVTKIKDQGQCGNFLYTCVSQKPVTTKPIFADESPNGEVDNVLFAGCCWAFSAVAAIEGIYQIKTEQLISLSEQQLLDCDNNDNRGCNGGFMVNAFNYVIQNQGIATETNYPYQEGAQQCLQSEMTPAVQISSYKEVVENSEEQLLQAVANQPVSVAISANGNFQQYNGGVFEGPCGDELNHAVTLIGYGTSEDGIKYWLIKNSWGEGWGEGGYMRLLRDSDQPEGVCGVAKKASYPTI